MHSFHCKHQFCFCQDIDDDDENNFNISESDNLLVVGKADDEFSTIEVHGNSYGKYIIIILIIVFNGHDNHSFCHHEILISAYPLALEWLDYDPGEPADKGKCASTLAQ